MGSVFPTLKAIDLQHWATALEIQNTGSASPPTQGRWKIQDKIRKFHFSMKCNSTAIRGGEAGKWEDHTWIENTENPILPSWRRFCLPLNSGFGTGKTANKPVWTNLPCRKLGFLWNESCGRKKSSNWTMHLGETTRWSFRCTWSTGWQHLRAIFVPYPQSPIWCWCFPAVPPDSVTSQCKLRKSSLKYLKTVQHHTWKQTV